MHSGSLLLFGHSKESLVQHYKTLCLKSPLTHTMTYRRMTSFEGKIQRAFAWLNNWCVIQISSKITDKDKHCYNASHGQTIEEKRITFSHQCNVISSETMFAPLHKR